MNSTKQVRNKVAKYRRMNVHAAHTKNTEVVENQNLDEYSQDKGTRNINLNNIVIIYPYYSFKSNFEQ